MTAKEYMACNPNVYLAGNISKAPFQTGSIRSTQWQWHDLMLWFHFFQKFHLVHWTESLMLHLSSAKKVTITYQVQISSDTTTPSFFPIDAGKGLSTWKKIQFLKPIKKGPCHYFWGLSFCKKNVIINEFEANSNKLYKTEYMYFTNKPCVREKVHVWY